MAANTQVNLFADYTRSDTTHWFKAPSISVKLTLNLEIIAPRRKKHKKKGTAARQNRLLQKKNTQNKNTAPQTGRLQKAIKIAGLARYAVKQLKGII